MQPLSVAPFPSRLQISAPVYNLVEPATNLTTNQPPHCAQLYNPRGLPWAFHHFPMAGRQQGFPVWFDINLDAGGAQTWCARVLRTSRRLGRPACCSALWGTGLLPPCLRTAQLPGMHNPPLPC